MQSNLSDDLTKKINEKVCEIATVLYNIKVEDCSLMYGKTGIVLFLFYYWGWKKQNSFYKKATELILDVFAELSKQIYQYKKDTYNPDFSFCSGLCGIGWGINHLIINGFIDCDLQETMCLIDATIYRKMINGIHSDTDSGFKDALAICMYALDREDRLSKEYVRRFVQEYNELIISKNNECFKNSIAINTEIISFIRHKFIQKHPDIISDFTCISPSFFDSTVDHQKTDTIVFNDNEKLNADSGLARGLTLTGYQANKKYRETGKPEYRQVAEQCFDWLLTQTGGKNRRMATGFWYTGSQGLWKTHYGLGNGLAGIGLALLAAITDNQSTWDECLYAL